jgi:Tfp pilus assembly protein PilN
MREIDFLPAWYPAIQRRYRWVMVQAWATLAILVLLTGYAMMERAELQIAGRTTEQTESQIRVSRQQLAKLTEKMKYEQELRRKDQILAQLGLGVDSTRLLKALEDAMTPEMALTSFSLEAQESPRAVPLSLFLSHRQLDPGDALDRRLKVSVDGVAPSDVEIATFMEHLQHFGCFENIAFPYLREGRTQDGHVLREFEVTFEVNLNAPAEARP